MRIWHFATAFMQHTRRDQGIVQARVAQHRIKKGQNAIPIIGHGELDTVNDEHFKSAEDITGKVIITMSTQVYMHVKTATGGIVVGAI